MDGCQNESQSALRVGYFDLFSGGGFTGFDMSVSSSFVTLGGWILGEESGTSCDSMILMALSSFIWSRLLRDSSAGLILI